ncbi:hypothetical protein CAI21_05630 [Alkalilimnicola ehrlichii]|uniref:DUF2845 domain-containing protein n=1 Tax=Alkalilimnicola ehrlichii TaxID=351052 RepID=A0A3E0X1E8_9GAMM|nr:DUF2845 domain-containing protein [Alkalilimnicola ehrlichii]RFA30527.1 hypothetical protein CAI21_05630 [Alkalilimnicola ehrlichii]RFA38075.1 hypothetical protein CAL65_07000 [Alkalilimnicola ehrlichii]
MNNAYARQLLFVLLLATVGTAQASSFRCDGRIVSTGDRKYDVTAACGEPDHVERLRTTYVYGTIPVEEEEVWYYNFGPRQFVRVLRFRGSRLESIRNAGYGFRPEQVDGECRPQDLQRGMSKLELLARCGRPDAEETRHHIHHRQRQEDIPPTVRVEPIEEWIYGFGPGQFDREVTIRGGEIVRVERGRRGR